MRVAAFALLLALAPGCATRDDAGFTVVVWGAFADEGSTTNATGEHPPIRLVTSGGRVLSESTAGSTGVNVAPLNATLRMGIPEGSSGVLHWNLVLLGTCRVLSGDGHDVTSASGDLAHASRNVTLSLRNGCEGTTGFELAT